MKFVDSLLKVFGLTRIQTQNVLVEQRVKFETEAKRREWRYEDAQQRDYTNLSVFQDEIVMAVSNEHENPLIGKVVGIDTVGLDNKSYVLIVENCITGEQCFCMGYVTVFTWQKFDALHKLSFDERIALIFGRHTDEIIGKSAAEYKPPYPTEVFREMVETALQKYQK